MRLVVAGHKKEVEATDRAHSGQCSFRRKSCFHWPIKELFSGWNFSEGISPAFLEQQVPIRESSISTAIIPPLMPKKTPSTKVSSRGAAPKPIANSAMRQISVSNWAQSEEIFQRKRNELLVATAATDVAGAPFVYADRQLVTSALTRIHLFEKALEVQGAIVECGVHKANSLFIYYHLSSILEPYNFNRQIIGFDTFEGFRSLSPNDHEKLSEADFSDTSYESLLHWSKLHDLNRAVSHIPKMELIKGDATATIPQYVADNPHLIIALLYLDFDIYAPTAVALQHLLPLVPKGGIVGFDEINCKKWKGETIALKEKITLSDVRLKKFYYSPWVSYYVVE